MTTVIVPGWHGSGDGHWQTWLQHRLAEAGRSTVRPAIGDHDHPDLAAWLASLRETLACLPDHGFDVVARSLGAVLWLHHVADPGDSPGPARVALVSPPSPPTTAAEGRSVLPAADVDRRSAPRRRPHRARGRR